jgi:tryptophan synthase alpha chain
MQENRVTETFGALAKKGERALVCYVVAGYHDVKTTVEILDAILAGGADIIELGIPFSDPIADGPTIQQASHKALEGGITPEKALGTAQTVRKRHPRLPLFVMTYSNILIRAGMDNFIARAKGCGIDGFILPDLPVEEADDYLTAAQRHEMSTVFLASPNTSDDRLGKIAASSSGFMYLVSIYGITGVRKTFEDYTETAI